jgi:nucleoside-diphosphate-sugar epimerase
MFQFWLDNAAALKKTTLQYTRIMNGFFMDYWGVPHLKSHLNDFPWAVHVESMRAAIPGTGDELMSMTYSFDVAKFVARLIDEDGEWPEVINLSGQDVSFNQVLKWAEEARGKKFKEVGYDSEEKLGKGEVTLLQHTERDEMVIGLTTVFGIMVIRGLFRVGEERQTDRFGDLKFMKVDEMIEKVWKGK